MTDHRHNTAAVQQRTAKFEQIIAALKFGSMTAPEIQDTFCISPSGQRGYTSDLVTAGILSSTRPTSNSANVFTYCGTDERVANFFATRLNSPIKTVKGVKNRKRAPTVPVRLPFRIPAPDPVLAHLFGRVVA